MLFYFCLMHLTIRKSDVSDIIVLESFTFLVMMMATDTNL